VLLWVRHLKLEYRSEKKMNFFLGREPQYLLSLLPILQKDYILHSWRKTLTDIAGSDGYFAHMSSAKVSAEPGG